MRMATWNLERPSTRSWKRLPRQLERVRALAVTALSGRDAGDAAAHRLHAPIWTSASAEARSGPDGRAVADQPQTSAVACAWNSPVSVPPGLDVIQDQRISSSVSCSSKAGIAG